MTKKNTLNFIKLVDFFMFCLNEQDNQCNFTSNYTAPEEITSKSNLISTDTNFDNQKNPKIQLI